MAVHGFRILALGYREIPKESVNEEDRYKIEKDLDFLGFLVLENNLKTDTKFYIKQLINAKRNVVILTGDHLLTSIATYDSLIENT